MSASLLSRARRTWRKRHQMAAGALYWSGLTHAHRNLTRAAGAVLLMYHSVADEGSAPYIDPANRTTPSDFERQMTFLARHRHVIALQDLTDQLIAGHSPRHGTVCITFDDGYVDNLTIAAPILAKLRLPATLFLPTGYIERAEAQWVDSLHCLFRFRTRDSLDLARFGLLGNLQFPAQQQRIRSALHLRLLESTYADRSALLDELRAQLLPSVAVPRLTMDWEDVRSMQRLSNAFEVGGHTRHHVDLRTHGADIAREEIFGCAQDIAVALGRTPRFFSFPYGRWNDESRALVAQSGWQAAIGASHDTRITAHSDRYVLARPETPANMTALKALTL